MRYFVIIVLATSLLISCRGKKASIYTWKGEEESRKLTLLKNNTFIIEVNTDYFYRVDTGTYRIAGDTLIINPDKKRNEIDSIVFVDSLFNGQRFLEVAESEMVFDTSNTIVESFYRMMIFPNVIVNDSIALVVNPDDPSYRKLIIPDSLSVKKITLIIQESNTCKPILKFHLKLSGDSNNVKSYRLFMSSRKDRENYLAGFKWLIKGDTIESSFSNENCDPSEIKLIRIQ